MCLRIVDLLIAGFDIPLAPGSDDRNIGREILEGQLKANLVVTLTGATVADSIGTLLDSDLGKTLCNAGASVRRAEQVLLVDSACLNAGNDVIVNVLVGEIENVKLRCACLECLFFKTLKLVRLTDVARNRDYLAVVVVFLEPRNDDRRIKTARVGENDFFNVLLIHNSLQK